MENLDDAANAAALQGWVGASHPEIVLFRTNPMAQLTDDFGSGMAGYPMMPVIDLQTMKVLKVDCFYEDWENCITAFL